MRRTYFLSYKSSLGTNEEIVAFIESCRLILTWRRELPNLYFLVSESSANEICEEIEKHFGVEQAVYLVAEIGANSQGRLGSRSWSIINDHRLPPKEA